MCLIERSLLLRSTSVIMAAVVCSPHRLLMLSTLPCCWLHASRNVGCRRTTLTFFFVIWETSFGHGLTIFLPASSGPRVPNRTRDAGTFAMTPSNDCLIADGIRTQACQYAPKR